MAPGAPAGRWLLIAFVAGMIAGGGLVAIPLFGAVDQVQDREAELEAQRLALNATAAQLLNNSAAAVADLEAGTPGFGAALWERAGDLETAHRLVSTAGGGSRVLEALFVTARSFELQAQAAGCRAIDQAAWFDRQTAENLTIALDDLGRALAGDQGARSAAGVLADEAHGRIGAIHASTDGLFTFHEARLQLANDTAAVHLELQAPVATEGCASLWAWEACPIQPGATPPCAPGATRPESAGVIDPGNVTVELTQLPDEAESIEVLQRAQLGQAGVAGCRMAVEDGATCQP